MLVRLTLLVYYSLPIAIDQFRILSVRPASSTTSPIIADLIVENFKNQHKHYDALSYTWGGFSNSDRIIVNGKEFPVTQNLRLAIQNLRHPSRATRLWIDCICINQADTMERNSQVQLMGWIYSQAHHVVIWLGDTSETSRVAMKLLNDCHNLESDEEIIQRVISDEAGGQATALLDTHVDLSRVHTLSVNDSLLWPSYDHMGCFTAAGQNNRESMALAGTRDPKRMDFGSPPCLLWH